MHDGTPPHEARPRLLRSLATNGWRRHALLAAVLVPALAGCGIIAGAIGPVDVGDPFAVDGHVVETTFVDGAIAPAALAHGESSSTFTVADMELDLRGFAAGDLTIDAGFAPDVTLTGDVLDDAPLAFTVTEVAFAATIDDGNHEPVAFTKTTTLDGVLFEQVACDAASCTYSYAGTATLEGILDLNWTDLAQLADFVAILTEPTSPNAGTLEVTIEVDSVPDLAGYTAAFTMVSDGSTIELD